MPSRVKIGGNIRDRVVPEGAIDVTRPRLFSNPFGIKDSSREEAIARFIEALEAGRLRFTIEDVRTQLAGKDLACWCKPDEACHADHLLAIANEP